MQFTMNQRYPNVCPQYTCPIQIWLFVLAGKRDCPTFYCGMRLMQNCTSLIFFGQTLIMKHWRRRWFGTGIVHGGLVVGNDANVNDSEDEILITTVYCIMTSFTSSFSLASVASLRLSVTRHRPVSLSLSKNNNGASFRPKQPSLAQQQQQWRQQ